MDFDSFHYDEDEEQINDINNNDSFDQDDHQNCSPSYQYNQPILGQLTQQDSENELETDNSTNSQENHQFNIGQNKNFLEIQSQQLINNQNLLQTPQINHYVQDSQNFTFSQQNTQQQLNCQSQFNHNNNHVQQSQFFSSQNIVKFTPNIQQQQQCMIFQIDTQQQKMENFHKIISCDNPEKIQKEVTIIQHNTNEFSFNEDDDHQMIKHEEDQNNNSSNNNNLQLLELKKQNSSSLKKQQSQFKNANKFFISNFLNHLQQNTDQNSLQYQYIMNIKKTGKAKRKVDLFTLAHYRVLFLLLDQNQNFSRMTSQDIQLHSQVFLVPSDVSQWTDEIVTKINAIKTLILEQGKDYFMIGDDKEIFQKIKSKNWADYMVHGYLQWVQRIQKKVREMERYQYIYRI